MIPIRDVIPSRTTPWVTLAIIAGSVAIFAYARAFTERGLSAFAFDYGFTPANPSWLTALTSLFVHDSIGDLLVNAWALWLFAENVEDRLGHGRFALFFLLAGVASCATELAADPVSHVPLIGPGGAIAGVMAAYFALFPTSRLLMIVPARSGFDVVEVPALVGPAAWLLAQLVGGLGRAAVPLAHDGALIWPYAGGALGGLVLGQLFRRRERDAVSWWGR